MSSFLKGEGIKQSEAIPNVFILDKYNPSERHRLVIVENGQQKMEIQFVFQDCKLWNYKMQFSDNNYISVITQSPDPSYKFVMVIPLGTHPSHGFYFKIDVEDNAGGQSKTQNWKIQFQKQEN